MKTKKPQNNDDESIIREIEEAVKHEQLAKLAKKYAPAIAAITVVLIIGLFIGKSLKDNRIMAAKAAGEKIYLALNNSNFDSAILGNAKANSDVNQISDLTKARLLAGSGEIQEASKVYEQIAANDDYDPAFRELATLNRASILVNSGLNNKSLRAHIEKVATNGKVFKYSAQELLAAYELQFGTTAAAKKIFEKLIADKNTPSGILLRAKQINSSI